MNTIEFHKAFNATCGKKYKSVFEQIVWTKDVDVPLSKHGVNQKNHQFVYAFHVRSSLEEPLSKLTLKKVGRTCSLSSRKNQYNQFLKRGTPDSCGFTAQLIAFLLDNENEKCYLTLQCLERSETDLVKAEREQFWKVKLRHDGYDLQCR